MIAIKLKADMIITMFKFFPAYENNKVFEIGYNNGFRAKFPKQFSIHLNLPLGL